MHHRFNETSGKWKKTSISKVLIILFGYLRVEEKFFPPSSVCAFDIGDNLPLVSLTPAASLPPAALTPVANLPPASSSPAVTVASLPQVSLILVACVVDTSGKFAVDIGGAP